MPDTAERSHSNCPNCGHTMAANAVLCIDCGYHTERGTQLSLDSQLSSAADAPPESGEVCPPAGVETADGANPYLAPTLDFQQPLTTKKPGWLRFLFLFWIGGRIPRGQWWAYTAGCTLASFGVLAMDAFLFNRSGFKQGLPFPLVPVCVLVFQWLIVTTQVKRWHDMDKSGLWYFINLIPIVGPLYTLVECGFEPGTEGPNDYGDASG